MNGRRPRGHPTGGDIPRDPAATARDDPAPGKLDLLFAQLRQRIGTANRDAEPPDATPPEKQR